MISAQDIQRQEEEAKELVLKRGWLTYWWGHVGYFNKENMPKFNSEGWFINTTGENIPRELSKTLKLINCSDKSMQKFELFEQDMVVQIVSRRTDLTEQLGFTPVGVLTLFRPGVREKPGILVVSNCIVGSKRSLSGLGYEEDRLITYGKDVIIRKKEPFQFPISISSSDVEAWTTHQGIIPTLADEF